MTAEPAAPDHELAVGELLGALAYGQLRAFVAVAGAVPLAPDLETARRLAAHAVGEHARYERLHARLDELTDLGTAVMERQRRLFDDFFDAAFDDWLGACVHLAAGLPIAGDFAEAVAPTVDDTTAEVIRSSLVGRDELQSYAEQLLLDEMDGDGRQRARSAAARQLGAALTGFQQAVTATDALRVLFEARAEADGTSSETVVKRLALSVLTGHRHRMHALGLEDLD